MWATDIMAGGEAAMEPKFCRICRLLLTLENAALRIDSQGKTKITDKCKVCLLKIFERLKEKRKRAQRVNFISRIRYKIKKLFIKVGERLGRLEI